MHTYAELIERWPNDTAFAQDVGDNVANVWKWKNRNTLPPYHWLDAVASARRRKISGVSLKTFAQIEHNKKKAVM